MIGAELSRVEAGIFKGQIEYLILDFSPLIVRQTNPEIAEVSALKKKAKERLLVVAVVKSGLLQFDCVSTGNRKGN